MICGCTEFYKYRVGLKINQNMHIFYILKLAVKIR